MGDKLCVRKSNSKKETKLNYKRDAQVTTFMLSNQIAKKK